jgi:hypothetical protein
MGRSRSRLKHAKRSAARVECADRSHPRIEITLLPATARDLTPVKVVRTAVGGDESRLAGVKRYICGRPEMVAAAGCIGATVPARPTAAGTASSAVGGAPRGSPKGGSNANCFTELGG